MTHSQRVKKRVLAHPKVALKQVSLACYLQACACRILLGNPWASKYRRAMDAPEDFLFDTLYLSSFLASGSYSVRLLLLLFFCILFLFFFFFFPKKKKK